MKKLAVLSFMLLAFNSNALETITGKVTLVEATYMPGTITFNMDTGNSTCPKGTWLKWSKTDENNKVTYSTLLTALVSGNKINFYIKDNDTTCTGAYLHLKSN
jgi:hypothetical protein